MASPGIPPDLWSRWEHAGAGLYEYCPLVYSGKEERKHPCLGKSDKQIEYLSGRWRLGIRHTPLITYLAVVYLYLWALVRLDQIGGADFGVLRIPVISVFGEYTISLAPNLVWLLGLVLAGIGLVIGVYMSGDKQVNNILRLVSIGSLFTILVAGSVLAAYGMFFGFPATIPKALHELLIGTGYTLTLFVGGVLVYDGMLRTENLFCRLDETEIIPGSDDYDPVRKALASDLKLDQWKPWNSTGTNGDRNPVRVVMGIVLLGLITVFVLATDLSTFGAYGQADWFLDFGWWGFVQLTRIMIILVAYKFVVLVTVIWQLSVPGSDVTLLYHPFHPDGLGGFRDIGKFATRVNVLIVLGGVYLLYFSLDNTGPLAALPWIVYSLVVILWFRYSFYALHRRMQLDKQEWLLAGGPPDGIEAVGGFAGEATLSDMRNSPEWPVSATQLTRLISVNAAPLLLWLLKVWLQPA